MGWQRVGQNDCTDIANFELLKWEIILEWPGLLDKPFFKQVSDRCSHCSHGRKKAIIRWEMSAQGPSVAPPGAGGSQTYEK